MINSVRVKFQVEIFPIGDGLHHYILTSNDYSNEWVQMHFETQELLIEEINNRIHLQINGSCQDSSADTSHIPSAVAKPVC